MNVLLFNGSPHKTGCTYTALTQISNTLAEEGIASEIIQIGSIPFRGCIACGSCKKTGNGCAFGKEDGFNALLTKCRDADGFVFGSPVYYASANGTLISFMDRLFYAGSKALAQKPAACICSARRAGTTATLDELQKYLTINQMPVVSSTYWPMVHGNSPQEVQQDLEGLEIMGNLARNMAWLLKCIEQGKAVGILPAQAPRHHTTNFIR